MMKMRIFSRNENSSLSERVIDGLLAGMIAGVAMLSFLLLVGWMFSEPATSVMTRFSAGEGPVQGVLLHLSVSGIYGILFSLARRFLSPFLDRFDSFIAAMTVGLIYGSFLWMISGMVLLAVPVSPFETLPQPTFAIAHLVYGVVLGALVDRWKM